jgi:DNA-binding IclR family transcriptional regulator
MKFLMIDSDLLENNYFLAAHKLVLAFLISLAKQGRGYWGSVSNFAKILGTNETNLMKVLDELNELSLIYRDSEGTIRLAADIEAIYTFTSDRPIRSVMRKKVEDAEAAKTFDEIMTNFLNTKSIGGP